MRAKTGTIWLILALGALAPSQPLAQWQNLPPPPPAQQQNLPSALKRFPWDMRPFRCFLDVESAKAPECQARPDWPNYADTVRRIYRLFSEPDFDLIERAERELGFSEQRFESGRYYAEAWYAGLQDLFIEQPGYATGIARRWAASKGTEGYAKLAQAMISFGESWEARGRGYANTVTPEGWKLYFRKLEEADRTLDEASPRLKQTAPWHVLKLELSFLHPKFKERRLDLLKSATDRWPDYFRLYVVAMSYAHPRWGGSFEATDAVARFAVEKTKADYGTAFYALLYEHMFRGDQEYTLRDSKVDWDLMKRGFQDLEKRGAAPAWTYGNFARLACQMRDRAEARRLYEVHDRLSAPKTPQGVDACREFAKSEG